MRILLLTEFFLSGQTTHTLELAKQLVHHGHHVHIRFSRIHSSLFHSYYAQQLRNWGVDFATGSSLASLTYSANEWQPDIIHAHSSTLFSHAHKTAARFRIPFVLTCHGVGFSHPKYHRDLEAADHVIAVGSNVAAEIAPLCNQYSVIQNGIDVEYFVPPPRKKKKRRQVLYIGRMERKKTPGIEQLASILDRLFQMKLTIIGDWNPSVPGTKFLPWKPNLLPTLQKSGIVAACGRTAREAMACGNAVLLMQQHYDGLVSPALVEKDDFDFSGNIGRYQFRRLKKDLRKLFASAAGLRKLQAWSRTYVENNCSSETMAQRVEEVYKEALRMPRPLSSYLRSLNWWD